MLFRIICMRSVVNSIGWFVTIVAGAAIVAVEPFAVQIILIKKVKID